jgi:hypothetical protein
VKNIYAKTEPGNFPAHVSLDFHVQDHSYRLTVRASSSLVSSTVTLPPQELREMALRILSEIPA